MEEMSTTQLKMNAELFGLLQELSADENLMKKGIKALRRIVSKSKEEDPTLMTKEEYFAMLDRAEEQVRQGKVTRQLPDETVVEMLKRTGYAL